MRRRTRSDRFTVRKQQIAETVYTLLNVGTVAVVGYYLLFHANGVLSLGVAETFVSVFVGALIGRFTLQYVFAAMAIAVAEAILALDRRFGIPAVTVLGY